MGARQVVQTGVKVAGRKSGHPTVGETELIQRYAVEVPDATPREQAALARALRRRPQTVKKQILQAKQTFASRAGDYVDAHMEAVRGALALDDPKAYAVAAQASQWAIQNMSMDGIRVLEAPQKGASGPSIAIGIKIGGLRGREGASAEIVALGPADTVEVGEVIDADEG